MIEYTRCDTLKLTEKKICCLRQSNFIFNILLCVKYRIQLLVYFLFWIVYKMYFFLSHQTKILNNNYKIEVKIKKNLEIFVYFYEEIILNSVTQEKWLFGMLQRFHMFFSHFYSFTYFASHHCCHPNAIIQSLICHLKKE